MRNIQQFVLKGCGFAVLITTVFYLFAMMSGIHNASMPVPKFFLILLFGFIISGTRMIYCKFNLNKILRELIQYVVLLTAFCLIFLTTKYLPSNTFAQFIESVAVFTVFYILFELVALLLNKLIRNSDIHFAKKKEKNAPPEKPKYQSLYKD